ncbi:hypothetical protein BKA82DRAFT_1001069 [Pisolithus tinctorius]|uniref:Uncharacterized protein n=1 Tax=Pisolithus tinctorius Marx 270 TaxID=870435 RepID=A0A0C3NSQ6_PISTI|nr:hypothetical protein BKA82DRAFT_1001069 [Pisolithus tinctorius]KIO03895.1 hypothetical protein M404DRAFT_1001069 [Pisolithus tinctorius Marx 270]
MIDLGCGRGKGWNIIRSVLLCAWRIELVVDRCAQGYSGSTSDPLEIDGETVKLDSPLPEGG